MNPTMARLEIVIPSELRERLVEQAKHEDRSMAAAIRRAITEYLTNHEGK